MSILTLRSPTPALARGGSRARLAVAALAVAEAKGTSTTAHRFRAGFTSEPWASLVEQAEHATWDQPEAAGPVPEAQAVAADA